VAQESTAKAAKDKGTMYMIYVHHFSYVARQKSSTRRASFFFDRLSSEILSQKHLLMLHTWQSSHPELRAPGKDL